MKDPERRPTLANIRARLQAAIHRSKRIDTLLIGLAGHGLQFGGDRDSYFCPADANPTELATLLSLGQLFRDLDECGGTKLVLVDACRDDPAVGRGVGGRAPSSSRTRSPRCSVAPLASGRFESDKYAHGVFFYHILQGLQGAASDSDGEVTWLSLTDYVTKRVPKDVARLHGGRVFQTPTLRSGEMAGASPVLARKAKQVKGTLVVFFRGDGARAAAEHQVPPSQPRVAFAVPGCGGDRLGLKAGDLLLQVDGWDVATVAEAVTAIKNCQPGSRIELTVERAGQRLTLPGPYETVLSDSQIISRVRRLADRGDVEAQLRPRDFPRERPVHGQGRHGGRGLVSQGSRPGTSGRAEQPRLDVRQWPWRGQG